MTEWTIFAVIYCVTVVLALGRVIYGERKIAAAVAALASYERRVKAEARRVRVAGAPGTSLELGSAGTRVAHVVDFISRGFELRDDSGKTIAIAEGAKVTVLAASAQVDGDGRVTIPAGTTLMHLPEEQRADGGPMKAPGAEAVLRGDAILLFAPDATLVASPHRVHRLAWARVIVFALVCLFPLVMSALYAPNTRWNVPMFFLLLMLLLDQAFARGAVSQNLCWRPPRP